ncbi:hypothetical protein Q8F55_006618 [Vanrija albida]|uniref:Ser-Thr-rich glycosyl-phosphatidyl-inositol-anchored membrane family-domain-containing protein n=1 Tax=Vanrija albida TaxID=181172 RepID=A0ABR3PXM4_9TREE
MLATKLLLLFLAPLALAQDNGGEGEGDGGEGNDGSSVAPSSSAARPSAAPANATSTATPASGPDSLTSQTVWTAFRPPASLSNGTTISFPHNGSWAVLGEALTVRWNVSDTQADTAFFELWSPSVGRFKGNYSAANAIPAGAAVKLSAASAGITFSADQVEPGTGYVLRLVPGTARPAIPQVLGTSGAFEIKKAGEKADPEANAKDGGKGGGSGSGAGRAGVAPALVLAAGVAGAVLL